MAARQLAEAPAQGFLRPGLQFGIQRGLDAQPAPVEVLLAVGPLEVPAHLFAEVRPHDRLGERGSGRQRLGLGGPALGLRDESRGLHAAERGRPPGAGEVRVAERGLVLRALDDSGEQRGLGERDLADALAEVVPARGLDAVVAVAEIDLVGVHREDLVLGVAPLDLEGDEGFVDLARERLLRREEDRAGELLRERRAALGVATLLEVRHEGRDRAAHVDAPVPEEVLVLGGHDRVADDRRDLGARNQDPPLDGVAGDRRAVARRDLGDDVRPVGRELRNAGNADEPGRDRAGDRAEETDDEEGKDERRGASHSSERATHCAPETLFFTGRL